MKPRAVERGALFLISVAAIVAGIAVGNGHWITVIAMVLVIFGQGLAFRKARAKGSDEINRAPMSR